VRRRKRQLASTGEYISGWGSREWRIDPPVYVFTHLGFLFAVPGLQTVLGLHPVLFLGDRDGARCCWLAGLRHYRFSFSGRSDGRGPHGAPVFLGHILRGHGRLVRAVAEKVPELPETVPGQMNALGCFRNEQPAQQD